MDSRRISCFLIGVFVTYTGLCASLRLAAAGDDFAPERLDICEAPGSRFFDKDSETEYQAQNERRQSVGNLQGIELTQVSRSMFPVADDASELPIWNCDNLEYTVDGKKHILNLIAAAPPILTAEAFHSIEIQGDKLKLTLDIVMRGAEDGATWSGLLKFNPKTEELKLVQSDESSPEQEKMDRIFKLIRTGNLAQATKAVAGLDRVANGFNSVTPGTFSRMTAEFLAQLQKHRKKHPLESTGKLALAWYYAWFPKGEVQFTEVIDSNFWYETWNEESAKDIPLWNDLAFYLEEARESALAQTLTENPA